MASRFFLRNTWFSLSIYSEACELAFPMGKYPFNVQLERLVVNPNPKYF